MHVAQKSNEWHIGKYNRKLLEVIATQNLLWGTEWNQEGQRPTGAQSQFSPGEHGSKLGAVWNLHVHTYVYISHQGSI